MARALPGPRKEGVLVAGTRDDPGQRGAAQARSPLVSTSAVTSLRAPAFPRCWLLCRAEAKRLCCGFVVGFGVLWIRWVCSVNCGIGTVLLSQCFDKQKLDETGLMEILLRAGLGLSRALEVVKINRIVGKFWSMKVIYYV